MLDGNRGLNGLNTGDGTQCCRVGIDDIHVIQVVLRHGIHLLRQQANDLDVVGIPSFFECELIVGLVLVVVAGDSITDG